jgi:antitoxin component of MazEF toxin-antitoxin module
LSTLKIKELDGKLCIILPDDVLEKLKLKKDDSINVNFESFKEAEKYKTEDLFKKTLSRTGFMKINNIVYEIPSILVKNEIKKSIEEINEQLKIKLTEERKVYKDY